MVIAKKRAELAGMEAELANAAGAVEAPSALQGQEQGQEQGQQPQHESMQVDSGAGAAGAGAAQTGAGSSSGPAQQQQPLAGTEGVWL